MTRTRSATRTRLSVERLDDRCLPSGGVLDPTFGTAGIVTTNPPPAAACHAYAVTTYPNAGTANDGKIVAAGMAQTSNSDIAVARYNLDGTVDKSFGGSGQVTTSLGNNTGSEANDVKVQSDGKVVVVGGLGDFVVVRYNANGSLDTSFGGNAKGKVITDFNRSYDRAWAMGLQTDGKIVAAGVTAAQRTSSGDLALARYNADGTLDSSFGTGGKVTVHFASSLTTSSFHGFMDMAIVRGASALDPTAGKIVVAAQLQNGSLAVVRFNTNGSLDASFGGGAGYATISGTLSAYSTAAVAVQADDRIVVTGTASAGPGTNHDIGLARFNADGTLDATFGSGGIVVTSLPTNDLPRSVTIQPDGKIVVAGTRDNGAGTGNFMTARYNPIDGSLDSSFGTNGVAVSTGGYVYVLTDKVDVALEPDGRIVVAGTSYTGGTDSFTLARFLAAGPQIGSFTANPNPVTAGSSTTLTAGNIQDANPGSTITQVAFYVDSNGDGKLDPATDTLLGYGTQASTGTWTYTFAVGLASGTYTLFAQAEDNFGVFSDPLAINVTVI